MAQKEGDFGGGVTQCRTVRKIGKYWNTMSKINEMPIPHLWSTSYTYLKPYPSHVFVYLKHVCVTGQIWFQVKFF